jgi:multiple sugar transport system permease protein
VNRSTRSRFAVAAVLPFAAFLLVVGVYPVVQLVRMSLSDVSVERGAFSWSFAGFDNFAALAHDEAALRSVLVTGIFIAGALPLSIVLGAGLAVLVDRSVVLAGVARNMILWPAVVAPVVVSLMWLLILSPSVGVLNKMLSTFGLPAQGWLGTPAGAMLSVIAVDVWHWTPVVFLLVYTALRGIDAEILEAARVDGAGDVRILRHVVLPLLLPALAAAALIRLVMCVKAFDEMFLLTRGGPGTSTTLVSLHIRTVFFDRLELGGGAAFSVAVVAGTGLLLALFTLLRLRWVRR